MIGWISNKIMNCGRNYSIRKDSIAVNPIRTRDTAEVDGIRFTVMSARGGTIVQLISYDRAKDRNDTITYVIPDGEDISDAVGRIVSMELWRQ
jgi:hypothetical protein